MTALSIFAAAREAPERPCLVTAHETRTFAQIAQRVAPVVALLEERHDPQAAIALVPDLRVDSLIAIYAALEVGAPIIAVHPRLTPDERRAVVGPGMTYFDEAWTAPVVAEERPLPSPGVHASSLPLAELFTSGSSGRAKVVVLSRGTFLASAEASAANLGWNDDDRWLLSMPLAHVGGISVVIRCLVARLPVALASWRKETPSWLAEVSTVRATVLSLVPAMLHRLLEETPSGPLFGESVRAVIVGGDACPEPLREEARRRGVPLLTTYGMTETCAMIATSPPNAAPVGSGRPLRGVEIRVVDGELQVRSPTLLTGYRVGGELSSPLDPEGWYATGDLGSLDADGHVHVSGRRSDLIISGGENVDPVEIERVLGGVSGARELRAFGVPDPRWGQVVALAVTGADDAEVRAALLDASTSRLAPHKRPRRIAFCAALPTGASGKIERKNLARLLEHALGPFA